MAMDGNERVVWILAGIGLVAILWLASEQTEDSRRTPEVQTDESVLGLGVQAGNRYNAGTPLDMTPHVHIWHPGYDPDPTYILPVNLRVRYPAIPGGNLSTVMHKGWSSCIKDAPAGNLWRLNPPEAAVL